MLLESKLSLTRGAHYPGKIDPSAFTPYPKNPTIAKIFVNIGLTDTLGSSVRNLYKYSKIYCGGEPELEEGDVFRIFVPLKAKANGETNRYGLTERQQKILFLLRANPTIKIDELSDKLETSESTINRDLSEMKKKVSISFNKKLQKWVIE